MSFLDNYLKKLTGNEEENPDAKKERLTKKSIWLYHGTKLEFLDDIKKNGLLVRKMGSNMGAFSNHPSGKPCISYTTNKFYAMAYTRKVDEPLLVFVPTKDLFFGVGGTVNEYLSTNNIPSKDILFPGDPKYKQIESKYKFLENKRI